MFFTYDQNNSGGGFDFDEHGGITHFVIIEADNVKEATEKAESIGIYFNGCDSGIDCDCCGDRWYEPWKKDGTEHPEVYGQPASEYTSRYGGWMKEGHEIAVHYKDGSIHWFGVKKENV